ncbi:hypothetical protein PSECIP111951_01144 [Pseudoalteromonas holothuriae]|uniref:Tail fiber protein n=1 Tax=Pseudoalteromonas holothuriae TaxID=2963714 RepID=A0ABN8UIT9_9GAMM|nr:hypothetical protein [Pseudoalteromonas sp. CIP111951]CAH9054957.1 hypothetical protein PSECIP111951_01144 [Pseudoalteromonas sp. CIP111951]
MSTELTNAVTALENVTAKHTQLNTQYQGTHDALASNSQAMTDWQTQQGTVELTDQNGNKHPTPTLKTLVEQAQSVNPHPDVMTKAQFDALRQMRKQQYAGSGFVEWGKHLHNSLCDSVNEGLWTWLDRSNTISIGVADSDVAGQGVANTKKGVVVIDGVITQLSQTCHPHYVMMLTPPAPDGTKTYDSATGTVTQHSNAEVAFSSETNTNKVITSRKDLVFLESWHEKIADKDVVYPLGNVQYGASSYEGIALLNNLVAQGYSAFGEWDENTKGYGVKWSTLTDEQKAVFLSGPEHNIYYDPKAKAYIQVRYRIRVTEGCGDDWVESITPTNNNYFRYNKYHQSGYISPQGVGTIAKDFNLSYPVFTSANRSDAALKHDDYLYGAAVSGNKPAEVIAFEGLCFAIPIALVQRLNQGAYHPVFNPMGCRTWAVIGNSYNLKWHSNGVAGLITSTSHCFEPENLGIVPTPTARSGYIGAEDAHSGRPDQYKYHDAIYAGQVEDLRLKANKLDVNQLREDTMRKAVAGTLRGKERVPYTVVQSLQVTAVFTSGGNTRLNTKLQLSETLGSATNEFKNVAYVVGNSGRVYPIVYGYNSTTEQASLDIKQSEGDVLSDFTIGNSYHFVIIYLNRIHAQFDSLPWVDIIGTPENIAATFPDGVVGQWIAKLPDNSNGYPLNKKMTGNTLNASYTRDLGQTWTNSNVGFDVVKNTSSGSWNPDVVTLLNYESSSNITNSSDNSPIHAFGNVFSSSNFLAVRGARLMESLIGRYPISGQGNGETRALPLTGYTLDLDLGADNAQFMGRGSLPEQAAPKHNAIMLRKPLNNSGAFKVFDTVTEKNGLLYLQFHGAELKHNGTDWGDDQTIPIVDGENVKIDLNGNTVKVFCHHTQFPIGIAYNN